MCIIMHKPAGVSMPDKATLARCCERNKDFGGYMIADGDRVIIKKGYKDDVALINSLNSTLTSINKSATDCDVVIHFRFATRGVATKENAHPFPLSENMDDMTKTRIRCDCGIAHNGTISRVTGEKDRSDSQIFAQKYIGSLSFSQIKNNSSIKELVDHVLYGDRLILMSGNGDTIKFGKWVEDDDGRFYSNDGFKEKKAQSYHGHYGYGTTSGTGHSGYGGGNKKDDNTYSGVVGKKETKRTSPLSTKYFNDIGHEVIFSVVENGKYVPKSLSDFKSKESRAVRVEFVGEYVHKVIILNSINIHEYIKDNIARLKIMLVCSKCKNASPIDGFDVARNLCKTCSKSSTNTSRQKFCTSCKKWKTLDQFSEGKNALCDECNKDLGRAIEATSNNL